MASLRAGSSPVCATGGIAGLLVPCVRFGPYLKLTISEIPLPSMVNAGISIQNHQILPAGANAKTARETNRKPSPIKALVIPFAKVAGFAGSRARSRSRCRRRPERASGKRPVNACGTRLKLLPHERQNFVSSLFSVAHFGQYIVSPRLVCSKNKLLRKRFPIASVRFAEVRVRIDQRDGPTLGTLPLFNEVNAGWPRGTQRRLNSILSLVKYRIGLPL